MDYRQLLNFIFPLSADEKLIRGCSKKEFLNFGHVKYKDDFISLLPYQNQTVRAAIHLTKYHAHKQSSLFLAAVLENFLSGFDPEQTTLIPVPLSRQRLRDRGYNQVSLVANRTTFPSMEKLLQRHRHTLTQTSLQKNDRVMNVKDAFSLANDNPFSIVEANTHIILLDDVATTGSTLVAAKTPLQKAGYRKITCVALAH